MTSLLRLAANTCLKFLPLAVRPAINERAIVIENPNRLVKCSLHTALHSKRHLKVTLPNDCMGSSEFDLIIMQALGHSSQHNKDIQKGYHRHIKKLDTAFIWLCQQRDCKEKDKIYKLTRIKRNIRQSPKNTTKYPEVTSNENVTHLNLTEYVNTTKQSYPHDADSLVKEPRVGKEIDDIIENIHNVLSIVFFNVKNNYCNNTHTLRSSGGINVKKGLIMNGGTGFTIGKISQHVLSKVSGDIISMGKDLSEDNDFGLQGAFPTMFPRTVQPAAPYSGNSALSFPQHVFWPATPPLLNEILQKYMKQNSDSGNQGLGSSFGSIGSMVSAFLPQAKNLIKKYGIPMARKILNHQLGGLIANQVCKLAGCGKQNG